MHDMILRPSWLSWSMQIYPFPRIMQCISPSQINTHKAMSMERTSSLYLHNVLYRDLQHKY